MGSPEKLSQFLASEFEESENTRCESDNPQKSMEPNKDNNLVNQLWTLKASFEDWGTKLYDKKKICQADYKEFLVLCENLAVIAGKTEVSSEGNAQNTKVDERLNMIEKQIEKLSSSLIVSTPIKKPSYAEMVQLPKKKEEKKPGETKEKSSEQRSRPVPKDKTILIKPKEIQGTEKQTSENLKKVIKKTMSIENSLKVKKAINVNGGGVLLVMDSSVDKNKIFSDSTLQDAKFEVSEPPKIKPKLVIYNVPAEWSQEEIVSDIFNRNFQDYISLEKFRNSFKPIFKIGPKDRKQVNWVVECAADIRNKLKNMRRVFIDWSSSNVKDFVSVSRCFKCNGLGHIGRFCSQEHNTCSHCAETNHDIKSCPNLNKQPVCINCKKRNNPANHKVSDKNCPEYEKALRKVVEKTDYGY
ncbi:uncharacterized protein LOC120349235 [Nilaparvata lugens]|uniref:uncharacterized protein LOC120349235 n=1 Tax=Nilaparvata lugens TaxID=108931 RepID=UPI00193E9761|nr:uncharacterized protein LOC120349235 [Nilaparvata lugens]